MATVPFVAQKSSSLSNLNSQPVVHSSSIGVARQGVAVSKQVIKFFEFCFVIDRSWCQLKSFRVQISGRGSKQHLLGINTCLNGSGEGWEQFLFFYAPFQLIFFNRFTVLAGFWTSCRHWWQGLCQENSYSAKIITSQLLGQECIWNSQLFGDHC